MGTLLEIKNQQTLKIAREIFRYDSLPWGQVKDRITADNVKEFYTAYKNLWPIDTAPEDYLQLDDKLTALYLGDIIKQNATRSINAAAMYSDRIIITDPFQPVWCINDKYNPIYHSVEYLSDTLKVIYFLSLITPAIESGLIQIFPSPEFFDHKFRMKSWTNAEQRIDHGVKNNPKLKAAFDETISDLGDTPQNTLLLSPEHWFKRKMKEDGLSSRTIKNRIKELRRIRNEDPLLLKKGDLQTLGSQYELTRSGLNLETTVLVASLTDAFPVTYSRFKWEEFRTVKEDFDEKSDWMEISKAIQDLPLGFLDTLSSEALVRVRNENMLSNFRSLLAKIKKTRESEENLSKSAVRDIKDQLSAAYCEAKKDYNKIDQKLLHDLIGTIGAGSLIYGILNLDFATMSGSVMKLIQSFISSTQTRKAFVSSSPMGMFVELDKKKKLGIEY